MANDLSHLNEGGGSHLTPKSHAEPPDTHRTTLSVTSFLPPVNRRHRTVRLQHALTARLLAWQTWQDFLPLFCPCA